MVTTAQGPNRSTAGCRGRSSTPPGRRPPRVGGAHAALVSVRPCSRAGAGGRHPRCGTHAGPPGAPGAGRAGGRSPGSRNRPGWAGGRSGRRPHTAAHRTRPGGTGTSRSRVGLTVGTALPGGRPVPERAGAARRCAASADPGPSGTGSPGSVAGRPDVGSVEQEGAGRPADQLTLGIGDAGLGVGHLSGHADHLAPQRVESRRPRRGAWSRSSSRACRGSATCRVGRR